MWKALYGRFTEYIAYPRRLIPCSFGFAFHEQSCPRTDLARNGRPSAVHYLDTVRGHYSRQMKKYNMITKVVRVQISEDFEDGVGVTALNEGYDATCTATSRRMWNQLQQLHHQSQSKICRCLSTL